MFGRGGVADGARMEHPIPTPATVPTAHCRRRSRRIGLGRFAIHLLANCCILVLASGVGHAVSRPPHHGPTEAGQAVESLIAGRAVPAVVPSDFDAVSGYRPVVQSGTLAREDGGCSTPFGIGPDAFEAACRTHDLGYDLLRYAEKTDGRLAASASLVCTFLTVSSS